MSRKKYIILALLLTTYALLTILHPGGLMAYIFPSTCWTLLALATMKICGLRKIQSWFNKRIAVMAALIAVIHIFALIDAGLITGFGRSPLSFTPTGLTINLIFILSALFGTELSRACLMKNLSKKKPYLTLGLVTLLYTFLNVSILGLLTLLRSNEPLTIADFLGTSFLPTVTENLLASYLAFLGGPIASLAYRLPIQVFQWFSPILPNLTWGYEALLGVMVPTMGFIIITQATTPKLLKKLGVLPRTRKPVRRTEAKKSSMRGWMIVSILSVLIVWTSTGLLGFYPTIPLSGSMRPTLDIGDIAIIIPADPNKIQIGDIIQYWQNEEMTLHRVIDIQQTEGSKLFITKGDDNPIPDSDPVSPAQIRGKLLCIIPKIGWISIYIKTAIAETISFFTNNILVAYVTLAALVIALTSKFHFHWNSPTRRLRRRMHR